MSCGFALMTACEVAVLIESSRFASVQARKHHRAERIWRAQIYAHLFYLLRKEEQSPNVLDAPNEVQTCPHLHMNSRHESPLIF